MLWIISVGVVSILLYYILTTPLNYWRRIGVKQGKPWILLGDNWRSAFRLANFYDFIEEFYNMFPGTRYMGVYQFTTPTLLLRDPELIKQIAIKDFDHFTDHRTLVDPEADILWGRNLLALKGQKWRDMRATLSASFTSSKMRTMFTLISEAAEHFVEYFANKNQDTIELEMKDIFTRFTNDVIATSAFGIKVDSLTNRNNDFYLMGKEASNFRGFWTNTKFFGYLIAPKLFKLLKVQLFKKSISNFFRSLIKETIRTREEQGIVRPDMINLLLEARKGITKPDENEYVDTGFATAQESNKATTKPAGEIITDDDITSQALIFFLAGFDTVSNAMCFTTYELAVNPHIQEKLRIEIQKTWKKCDGKLTYEALLNMKYMDMVVSESLRKWPPAPLTDRICTKTYTIDPVVPGEVPVELPKGRHLIIPVFGIHRDPMYYPDPENFDPERFSDENKSTIKPCTYMPFGVGPRNCIGSRFALLEVKAAFFYILANFKIVPSKKLKIPLQLSRKSLNVAADGGFWFELQRLEK